MVKINVTSIHEYDLDSGIVSPSLVCRHRFIMQFFEIFKYQSTFGFLGSLCYYTSTRTLISLNRVVACYGVFC